jgi:hypothetical protein
MDLFAAATLAAAAHSSATMASIACSFTATTTPIFAT